MQKTIDILEKVLESSNYRGICKPSTKLAEKLGTKGYRDYIKFGTSTNFQDNSINLLTDLRSRSETNSKNILAVRGKNYKKQGIFNTILRALGPRRIDSVLTFLIYPGEFCLNKNYSVDKRFDPILNRETGTAHFGISYFLEPEQYQETIDAIREEPEIAKEIMQKIEPRIRNVPINPYEYFMRFNDLDNNFNIYLI